MPNVTADVVGLSGGAIRFLCATCRRPISSSDAVVSPQGAVVRVYHDSETGGRCLDAAYQDRLGYTDNEDTLANTMGDFVATVGLTLA